MSERKLAPHVARAIGAVQAKPAPARSAPPGPPSHVAAAVAVARHASPGAPLQAKPAQPMPVRAPAPHVKSAGAAPPRLAAPAASASRQPAAPSPPPAKAVQPYRVLGSEKIWNSIPAGGRPWSGYPYILAGAVDLPAQQRRKRDQHDEGAFLNAAGKANVVRRQDRGMRLSDDYKMAVEDSNLGRRQPKTVFLANSVLQTSNARLAQIGSKVRLVPTGRTITAIGWWKSSDVVLHEVKPKYDGHSANRLPQNCNDMACRVTGKKLLGGAELEDKMLGLLGKDRLQGVVTEQDLRKYVRGGYDTRAEALRLNDAADPEIGEAFMIGSLHNHTELYLKSKAIYSRDEAESERLLKLSAKNTITDYAENREKQVPWPYHYGAVVAVSGTDRITLENYARGDNGQDDADPRWFFQMYGTDWGQSFNEVNQGDSYGNPLTIAAGRA